VTDDTGNVVQSDPRAARRARIKAHLEQLVETTKSWCRTKQDIVDERAAEAD
jgi:hypothetical protein